MIRSNTSGSEVEINMQSKIIVLLRFELKDIRQRILQIIRTFDKHYVPSNYY